jgi:hypothetical protein
MSRATRAGMIDEARTMLAAVASRAEQRNRPRTLVLASMVLLVLGAWFAWSGYRSAQDASSRARAAQTNAEKTVQAASRLRVIQNDESGDGIQASAPMTQLLSTIEGLGPSAGLAKPVPLPQRQTTPVRSLGWNQVKATYSIRDASLDAILRWANSIVERVPGMEVHAVTVSPEATEWLVIIVFSRWEKAEGGS